MTTIVALKDNNGELWMAGDRRVSTANSYSSSPQPKVARRKGVLIAGCGLASLVFKIVNDWDLPETTDIDELFLSMIAFLDDNGWIEDGGVKGDGEFDSIILIGVVGKLYEIDLDAVMPTYLEVSAPCTSGTGGDYALGSLLTTRNVANTKLRLKIALSVAAQACHTCDDNIDIVRER